VQCASDHPAITTVVSGARGDQYAVAEEMRIAIGQDHSNSATSAFHKRGELDARAHGLLIPALGLLRGEDGNHLGHGER
jgi:hypothetical protein